MCGFLIKGSLGIPYFYTREREKGLFHMEGRTVTRHMFEAAKEEEEETEEKD